MKILLFFLFNLIERCYNIGRNSSHLAQTFSNKPVSYRTALLTPYGISGRAITLKSTQKTKLGFPKLETLGDQQSPASSHLRVGEQLIACADQLLESLSEIFNLSLSQATIPARQNQPLLFLQLKHQLIIAMSNIRPMALILLVMK